MVFYFMPVFFHKWVFYTYKSRSYELRNSVNSPGKPASSRDDRCTRGIMMCDLCQGSVNVNSRTQVVAMLPFLPNLQHDYIYHFFRMNTQYQCIISCSLFKLNISNCIKFYSDSYHIYGTCVLKFPLKETMDIDLSVV